MKKIQISLLLLCLSFLVMKAQNCTLLVRTDDPTMGGIRVFGTHNGHDYVDLGLSVYWATCNVGANAPEEYGDYYAWGEIAPKSDYSWATYMYANGASDKLTKYCNNSDYGNNGFTDTKTVLDLTDDAARANWGGKWRMPTNDELVELYNCTWTWTTCNGVRGYSVEGLNGSSIFLPAAGYRYDTNFIRAGSEGCYWSSTLVSGSPYFAVTLAFSSGNRNFYCYMRDYGLSVRPVFVR